MPKNWLCTDHRLGNTLTMDTSYNPTSNKTSELYISDCKAAPAEHSCLQSVPQ